MREAAFSPGREERPPHISATGSRNARYDRPDSADSTAAILEERHTEWDCSTCPTPTPADGHHLGTPPQPQRGKTADTLPRQGYTDGLFLSILDNLLWKIEDRRRCRPWWRQEEEAR